MSTLSSENQARTRYADDEHRRRDVGPWESGYRSPGPSLLLTGLAVAGLGLLAWYYLGPDFRRYMKMESM